MLKFLSLFLIECIAKSLWVDYNKRAFEENVFLVICNLMLSFLLSLFSWKWLNGFKLSFFLVLWLTCKLPWVAHFLCFYFILFTYYKKYLSIGMYSCQRSVKQIIIDKIERKFKNSWTGAQERAKSRQMKSSQCQQYFR